MMGHYGFKIFLFYYTSVVKNLMIVFCADRFFLLLGDRKII